jgi:DNA-binding transcriptional MerR regulator
VAERGRPLFSIGAVARMTGIAPATIRTWETRYGLVVPERSEGGQRLYAREDVDQLRFVKEQIDAGQRPGEAHRLLAERRARGAPAADRRLRVLLAERRLGAVDGLRELLGGHAFEVLLAANGDTAERLLALAPALVVIDTSDAEFAELSRRLRAAGTKIVPIEALERPLELLEEARTLLTR